MKQITQKELIELIEEKQKNAMNDYKNVSESIGYRTLEESRMRLIKKERNKAYIDAYQDLICYLNGVEIVPDLNKLLESAPITPYVEPKVEPLRNDRLREFEFANGAKRIIDAKAVKSISLEESYSTGFDVYVDTIIMKKNEPYTFCKALYDDLVEWWKYWKEN